MLLSEGLHFGDERIDLVRGGADEAGIFGEDGGEGLLAEADAFITGEAAQEIGVTATGAERFRRGEGVLFDGFVGGFAAGAVFQAGRIFYNRMGSDHQAMILLPFPAQHVLY